MTQPKELQSVEVQLRNLEVKSWAGIFDQIANSGFGVAYDTHHTTFCVTPRLGYKFIQIDQKTFLQSRKEDPQPLEELPGFIQALISISDEVVG